MIRPALLSIILSAPAASVAVAGPWLRAPGTGFLSSSGTITSANDLTGNIYGEYGLSPRFTLGVDINAGMDRAGIPSGEGIVFLRFPLSAPDATHKWAAHIGVGARYDPPEFFRAAELGLSWGHGFEWRERYGWVAVDALINVAKSSETLPQDRITKLDATLGLGVSPRVRLMGQVFFTHTESILYTTLAPSLLYAPAKGDITYQIGFEFPVRDEEDPKLKLGIWREF